MRHRTVSRAQVEQEVPDLRTEGLRAAFIYNDARTDDVRLTHAVLATARAQAAVTVNYAKGVELKHTGGRIAGARIEDRLAGRGFEVDARFVVNATGGWGGRG